MPDDEAVLIREAQRGRLDAFNRLVERYQDRVYGLAFRILSEPEAAADAAQDAFVHAYRHLKDYRGGSFRAWLFRITANACYDELRRRKRQPADSLESLPGADQDDGPPLPADTETPENAAQRAELRRAIERCVQALQPEQRLALLLSDVEGLNYQEIADSLGINLGTVKSRLSRARASVRTCLQDVAELLPPAYRLTYSSD
mgnify:CR=1 FL=1